MMLVIARRNDEAIRLTNILDCFGLRPRNDEEYVNNNKIKNLANENN